MNNTTIKALLHTLLIGICLLSLNTQAGVVITYIHNDALGTPIAGTDEKGNVKWRAQYQPYGEELLGERQLFGVRAGYTGRRDDPETGLTYMGARYYSPTIGRFMGVDPAGVNESNIYSFNRYAYANNNPYRFVDPDGESPVSAGLVFIARETGIGFGLGVIADSISQYAAFGEVDLQLALTSNAAIAGGEAGLLSGVARSVVRGISVAKEIAPKLGVSGGKGAGKGFSNKIKDQARKESGDTCVFCGTKTTRKPGPTRSEIDHSIPKSRNGNNSLENAQNTCRTCNRQKGAKTTEEFLR